MAQLAAFLVSSDDDFRRDFGRLVRSGSVPIGIVDDARGPEHVQPDLAFVDIRARRTGRPRRDRAASCGAPRRVDLRDRADEPSPT